MEVAAKDLLSSGTRPGLFRIGAEFTSDLADYKLHPAIMDSAVNVGIRDVGDGIYLPFSYRSLKILKPLSGKVYSYLQKKAQVAGSQETASFDIVLWDEAGTVIALAENYIIKKVPEESLKAQATGRELYYDIGWIAKSLDVIKQNTPSGSTMIFHNENGIGAAICRELKNAGNEVLEVTAGPDYRQVAVNQFTIGGMSDDYQKLCDAVRERGITRIIHLWSLTPEQWHDDADSFAAQQKRGLESLFYLTKGLIQSKISGPITLILIADYTNAVTGDEVRSNPLHAAFFGLGNVIGLEHDHIQCRCIDIDDQMNPETLLKEISVGVDNRVAYRNGNRYVEEFRSLDLNQLKPRAPEINDQGVYVITGGTGGLGLEIGKYLVSKHQVNLCLLKRTPFPGREAWPEILLRNEDRKLCRKIEAIQALEANGSEVCVYAADVSAADSLQAIFDALRAKYGRIKGIVHCAGVAGDGFIFRKDPHLFEQVINPKLKGTWVLDQLTKNDSLDFMVLFSSVNAFLGRPGQADYTAANAFLDAFTIYRNQKGSRTLAIDWPAWKETGMAVEYGVQNATGMFKALPTATALKAFDEVLNLDLPRVIIGELDYKTIVANQAEGMFALSAELGTTIQRRAKMPAGASPTEKRRSSAEIVIKGQELSEYSEIEQKLALTWSFVLGLEEVDVNDSFFKLGGDSILATRLLKEIETEYAGLIDITDLYLPDSYRDAVYLGQKLHPESKPKANISTDQDLDQVLLSLAKGEITADDATG